MTTSSFHSGCLSRWTVIRTCIQCNCNLRQHDQRKTCGTCITPLSELCSHKNKSHILLALTVQETPIYYNMKGNSVYENVDSYASESALCIYMSSNVNWSLGQDVKLALSSPMGMEDMQILAKTIAQGPITPSINITKQHFVLSGKRHHIQHKGNLVRTATILL